MAQILIVVGFFIVAMGGMMLALHFSKYKQRNSGCCGGVHCSTDEKEKHAAGGCYREKMDFVEEYTSN